MSSNNIETTVDFNAEQLNLSNEELFFLLNRALGHTVTTKEYRGYTIDDDEYITIERYGDKADKELLRLMKIRLEKPEEELKPVSQRL